MVAKNNAQATEAVKDLSFVSEVDVRLRQANFSRVAVDKAMATICLLNPEDLSAKDAIALLRLGLEQERKAMGIPEVVNIQTIKDASEKKLKAIQRAMAIIDSLKPDVEVEEVEEGETM
jgi:hypothetical protein